MKKSCGNTHQYFNAGSVQFQRTPKLLPPQNVLYDERTVSDWLVYLHNYAAHINFFNLEDAETAGGTWKDFCSKDISMLMARIAEEEVALLQSHTQQLMQSLQHETLGNSIAKKKFTQLFSLVFNVINRLDSYYLNLPGNLEFREKMANRIFSKVEVRLGRMISYFKAATDENLFDFSPANPIPEGDRNIENLKDWNLSSVWFQQSGHANWQNFVAAIAPDDAPFQKIINPPANVAAKINLAVRYQLLVESIKGLMNVFAAIVADAQAQFEATIGEWPSHEPDKALLIAFLKLLELYRAELNNLPKRHLDFYYKDALQLAPKAAVADSAFLVLEPAKNQTEFLLPAATQFNGGKDADGILRVYESAKDVVINQAKVLAKKAILKAGNRIYAAQNVATLNGIDKDLEFPEKGFPAFGTSAMPEAEIGFAVASHYLHLREGERSISVILECQQAMNTTMIAVIKSRSSMFVSGEKGWIKLTDLQFTLNGTYKKLTVRGIVSSEEKAVVAIDEKLHERTFYPNLPVVEVRFASRDYNYLKNITVANVSVNVSATGCQQIDAFANGSKVDLSKPFVPFGAMPKQGNELVFDVQEMLSKNVDTFEIEAQWQVDRAPMRNVSTITSGTSKFSFEQKLGNNWAARTVSRSNSGNRATYTINNLVQQNADIAEEYSKNATKGYLRIRLNDDLGHSGYATELSNHIIALNSTDPPGDAAIPNPYYTPALEWVKVNYVATSPALNIAQSASYKTDETVFFHITPFGGHEASGNMQHQPYPNLLSPIKNEGEFYLGLSNFGAGQSVQVLLAMVEGSANPLKAKQEINWQYLENNRWVDFASGNLQDGTNGLVQSGIVHFALPFDFEDQSTYFNEKMTWVRATIAHHTDAICLMKNAFAQAVQATLVSTGHADNHFENPLAAESIAKLMVPNIAIKSVLQPYPAFGGKPTESDAGYYQRVSERLRHKNRSITMWDYERLVLESFPELAKVKTLSHTRYAVDEITNEINYSESAPGHVAVVCVAKKTAASEAFEAPYTPINTLGKIDDFLKKLKPEWANIHVRNPIFEFVQVDFLVEFNENITDKEFYKSQLNLALKSYLSPWQNDDENELRFNWRIHKSAVIDFLDEQPFVHYVRDVKLNIFYSDGEELDVEEARARFAVSVLMSANNHVINFV